MKFSICKRILQFTRFYISNLIWCLSSLHPQSIQLLNQFSGIDDMDRLSEPKNIYTTELYTKYVEKHHESSFTQIDQ